MINKLKNYIKKNPYLVKRRIEKIEKMIQDGLPEKFRPSLIYLTNGDLEEETNSLVERIEGIRDSIANEGNKKIPIFYSPKPGSSGTEVKENVNPQPGKVIEFSMEQIAKTGKDRHWGTFMHLLSKSFTLKNVFELGSCAGISGCYLSSTGYVEHFITVEGSAHTVSRNR